MSMIEKLFLQTFERKKRIIEQAKHQTDLFDQHLASICLLEGIAPPPWLWSPSFPSFSPDPNVTELKKEELISELLLPHLQRANPCSSSHYSLYQMPIVSANKGLANASCTEVHASNNGTDVGDRLSILPPFPTDDAQGTFNGVLEPDVSVTSPQICVDAKISDNGPNHAQSLVKIQRSKSRQKALEIRNSAKASKSHSSDKNNVDVTISQGLVSGILSLQYDHVHKSEIVKPVETNTEGCEEVEAKIGESGGKKKNSDIYYGRTIRYGNSSQQNGSNDNNSSYVAQDNGPVQSMNDLIKFPNHLNELSELVNPSSLAKPSFIEEDVNAVQCRGNEINSNVFSDRITRSRSFISQANTSKEVLEVGNSSCIAKEDDGHIELFDKSEKPCNSVGVLLQSAKPSSVIYNESYGSEKAKTRVNRIKEKGFNIYGGRITRSRSIYDRRITRSTSSSQQLNGENECLKMDNSCGNGKEDAVSNAKRLSSHVDNIRELVKPLDITYECELVKPIDITYECGGEKAKARNCQNIDVGSDTNCHRTTNSSSTEKFNDFNFPKVDISPDIIKDADDMHARSFGKSSQLPQQSIFVEGVNLEVLSGTKPNVLPCTESIIVETDIDYDGLLVACSVTSVSNSDGSGRGEEVLESRLPSECAMLVKPKQLDFDDVEENSLLETSEPALENKQEGKSEKLPSTLLHSTDLLDKEISIGCQAKPNPSIMMPLLEKQEFYGEEEKAWKDSSETRMKYGDVLVDESIINSVQQKLDSFISQNRKADSFFMGSWPQHKRIKIGGQLTNALFAPPSLDRKSYQPIHMHLLEDAEQLDVGKSRVEDMEHQKIEEHEVSSSKLQAEEVAINLEERGRSASTAFTLMPEQQGASSVSSLKKLAAGFPQDCFMEKAEVAVCDVTGQPTAEENQFLFQPENKLQQGVEEVLICTEDTMQEKKHHLGEDKLSYCSFGSPRSQSMVGSEQNMPEFEGFVVETDDEQPCTGNEGINFDNLNLPPTALGRASVLEQLFKSTSLHTPLSHFSATYKLHKALNLFQSIPNGLLEGMELSTLNMNGDESEQLGGSYSCLNEEVNHALHGRSHSVSLPFSNAQAVWDSRKPCMSPVGKLWDGIPLKSGSSGKRVSSIPELPCIDEENENTDGVPDTFLGGIGPEEMISSVKRQPLADITKNSKPQMSICESEINGDRQSLASMNTEFSFSGTCDKAKKKGNQNSNKRKFTSKDKENQNLSLGGYGAKRGKESGHSRFSKPKLSGKTGFRKGGPSLSEKEFKRNNIVSNITSFIPLVQQTQAAAVITEKRNIKVKALEAADAAKRLAEKKDNERKMRKEALKLERARMEEQNLRQLEQEKKKKEEEQKKKEADMATKKRQREQEEKKEKERKRRRVEEAKRQQLEHEKKLRAQKEEKELRFQAPGGRASARKESKDRFGKNEKIEKTKGDINLLTMPDEPMTTKVSTIDTINASIIPEDREALSDCGDNSKVTGYLAKASDSGSVISNTSQEQSYDISPYKGSDDEDEDKEDDVPNTKFVPSWASKSQLALVISSQQRIDPESIFPPISFCTISEVLLPRKLQQR